MWNPRLVFAVVVNTIVVTNGQESSYNKKCSKPNEVYDPCPVLCPPRECGINKALILCGPPPKPGSTDCQPGCRCRNNYLRNAEGICVHKEDCPKCTAPHEVYDICPQQCPPRACHYHGDPEYDCAPPPKPGDPECEAGCHCAIGYVWNYDKLCIKSEECTKCRKNEVWDECFKPCPPRKCGFHESDTNCPVPSPDTPELACEPDCRCADGFYRNDEWICVPWEECPCVCPENEVYSDCADAPCITKTCAQLGPPVPFCPRADPARCHEGCVCKEGYLRADNGTCVPKEQCPTCGGDPNAVPGCGINCGKDCSDIGKEPVDCPDNNICNTNGCDCKEGFFYNNETNKCVLPENCPKPTCDENEVYSNCSNGGCGPRDCSGLGNKIGCVKMDQKYCRGGCICEPDYLRDENGECIPKSECPECGGDPNAQAGCGVNCNRHCSDIGKEPGACILICYDDACDCKPGYYLDDDTGLCVLPEDCKVECKENEVFSTCINGGCSAKKCSQYGKPVPCVRPRRCNPGCLCKEGWLRADDGTCIPQEQCPGSNTCGKNEVYDTCANGGCRTWRCNQGVMCVDPLECEGGCVCRDKYTRAANDTCIPESQCEPQCDGPNERAEECPDTLCTPQHCSELGYPWPAVPCPPPGDGPCPGPPGCVCESEYVRDDNGICIPKTECPSCGGDPNAVSGCGNTCGTLCSNYNQFPVPPCAPICNPNACDCKSGYVLDQNINKCVHPENCSPTCVQYEVYDECANGGCRIWNCSQSVECIYPYVCVAGCSCQENYTRNRFGKCIPQDQCEECQDPHEYYDKCAPRCPPQTCESIGKKYHCPIQPAVCIGACRCEPGYYRNLNNECISEEDCKKCTGPHEYYSCGGACDNVCATLSTQSQKNCPIINIKCNEMCYCEENYARDENGICIPIKECPEPQCKEDERLEQCPDNLCTPQSCSQLGFPIYCPDLESSFPECLGHPGCVCDNNKVRNDEGVCIPKEQCPSCGGDPNAVTGCGTNCGRLCSNYKKKDVVCTLECQLNACDCKKGYVLDDNLFKCVRPSQCTPTCGRHEVYSECANGGCRKWNCSRTINCIDPAKCKRGCVCKIGYSRDANGVCIPEDQCPGQCDKPHEYYDDCAPTCPLQTCDNIGNIFECPIEPAVCRGGCRCEKGYYRNRIGHCISEENCKKCTGPNEFFSCGGACDNVCATLNKQNQTNCPIINIKCNDRCYCEKDFARDANGICIPIDQCPGRCNKPHEYYDYCAPRCPSQTCESLDQVTICPIEPAVCRGACRCEMGYYRNKIGECISETNCRKCQGPNEYFSCGGACDNVCATLKEQSQSNCPIINVKCNPMCYCESDYARDENGICIPIDQCPRPQCGADERYEECPANLCAPQTCSQLGFPMDCPAIDNNTSPKCRGGPGCVCDNDTVRDDEGNCIPKEECPSCGGDPNAVSGCGNNCGRLCSNYKKKNVICPLICRINSCDCKKGYVFDSNTKKCVLPLDCTKKCGTNEVYSPCANGGCYRRSCFEPMICIDPVECIGGCICQDGFTRNDDGSCVAEAECPGIDQCNNPHEEVNYCAPLCPQQTCENIGKDVDCPDVQPAVCRIACVCEPGYYRNQNGDCVSEEQCLMCRGPNEYFSCGGACDNVCATLNKQNQTNCPIINIVCNEMCYCEPDYARDENGICIPIDSCPAPLCGDDEIYEFCPEMLCTPVECSQLGFPINCPIITSETPTTDCHPTCICDYGKVRDNQGECIPIEECPSCGGDFNAVTGCGNHCGRLCSNYKQKDVVCTMDCKLNSCDCREGYVYDTDKNLCVLPEECPPTECGVNEVYDSCSNGGCRKWNCADPVLCIDLIEGGCIGGCVCQDGYTRGSSGECIPEDECPEPIECGVNEVYDSCSNGGCRKWNCADPVLCIDLIEGACEGGCVCQEGFTRASSGECIPEDECPDLECGPNERYAECPPTLCTPLTCSELGYPVACPMLPPDGQCPSEPACVCDYGFVRDDEGVCIPEKDCPSCGGDPNAESGCGINCGKLCRNYNKGPVPCPKICRLNACDCRAGYVFDENIRKCVRPSKCTPLCGRDEVYSDCINGGCSMKNCSQIGKPVPCIKMDPRYCIKGCLCKDTYLRSDNGVCIPQDQCKPECKRNERCSKPNEYYERCMPCQPETCESIRGKKVYCKHNSSPCKGGCRCRKGYYRNKIGECITKKDCRRCTGPHEYFSCGGACDNVCATLYKQNQTNCPIINIKCNPMCYCEKGYARDAYDTCIPISQCPEPECGYGQKYERCPESLCKPLSCTDVGFPIACPLFLGPCVTKPDCICKGESVKDEDGNCIRRKECPSCGGDINAVSGCGGHCGNTCSDYKRKDVVCTAVCEINGCDCRKGFVYDNNLLKCVRPADCTPTCGKNEVFDFCANGGCANRNCTQLGGPILCIDPIECKGGCVCKKGYLRSSKGVCIAENKCPAPCKKPHEVYDPCPHFCPPQTCESIGKVFPCPPPIEECRGQCRCEPGYYRNKIGNCISERDCLKCTGPNEYFSCGVFCDNVCTTLKRQNQTSCPIKNKKCNEKCYCEEGFARDANNICIPFEECGKSCKGDRNAIPGCGTNCGKRCSDLNGTPEPCPESCQLNGCDCKTNYAYDKNLKKCVLPEECTPICGPHEVPSDCVNGGCQKKKCSELDQPEECVRPRTCKKGCLCEPGYLRQDSGVCVPIDKCDEPVCGANEVYNTCANKDCVKRTCADLADLTICLEPVECVGACVCREHYLRNDQGICISEHKCSGYK